MVAHVVLKLTNVTRTTARVSAGPHIGRCPPRLPRDISALEVAQEASKKAVPQPQSHVPLTVFWGGST